MADDESYEGVTVAGLAIVRDDGPRSVFLAKRAFDETDDPGVVERWEFVGGHLKAGEDPFKGASREFGEEIGFEVPPGEVIGGWRSEDGHYQGFVYAASEFPDITDWQPTDEVQAVGWFDADDIMEMIEEDQLRVEVANMDWSPIWGAVSGNREDQMDDDADVMLDEPELDAVAAISGPIQFHGVMAPEDLESGDARGFNAGSITARPGRLPFSWQKVSIAKHDGSVVVGSLDRMMRKDGMIHYQGTFMDTAEADEFCGWLAHFGRFGVSIDGDKGSLDEEKVAKTGVVWYEAVRAAGLTAVAIPAFHEAYVAFGPHPEMPTEDDDQYAVMVASGDLVSFDRGPGWVTNPRETKRIHDYWTKPGQPGYQKIRWGTPGDFRRARVLIGEKIGKNSPEDMKYLNQIIAQWHYDALGYWPGELGKPGNAPDTPENRRRAARHAAALDEERPPAEPLFEPQWEEVLVSSGAVIQTKRKHPPLEYFNRHPNTDANVIEEPDENGFRRTYGYAAEWGICHVGIDGRCQEVPFDPNGGTYPWFHLGRTKVVGDNGELTYIKTGLITYGKQHRSAQEILSETPTQAHFDDIRHAWAAVAIGEDERGVWYSGVVLPTIEEKWLTAIEASGQVSGEWKHGELRTLLTVNVAGYPVVRSSAYYGDDGELLALSASALSMPFEVCEPPEDKTCAYEGCKAGATWGVWTNPDEPELVCAEHVEAFQNEHTCVEPEPTPAEIMAALRQADIEAEFELLKEQFLAEQSGQ